MSSQKPTILHVIDTTGPGGAETVFLDLAEKLDIKGYDRLALIKGSGWVCDQLLKRNIPHVVLKPFGFLSIPYYLKVIQLCRKHNVKFIQGHLLGSALTVSIVSIVTRIPAVATLHGQVDVGDKERFIGLKRWLLRLGLRKIITVSRQLSMYLESRNLFEAEKVMVIHNGVDVKKYNTLPQTSIRKELGLKSNAVLIGSLGNIRTAKDYPTLIRAAHISVSKDSKRHFVIAGHKKEPLQSKLEKIITELNLNSHVHFLGFREDTVDFLKQLNCFVLSSKAEGFSIATLEAMAANIPVVATKSGGPEEIIRPDVDGIMVATEDADQLSGAIEKVLDHSVDHRESAHCRVDRDFGITASIDKYRRLVYDNLKGMETKDVVSS